MKKWLKIFLGTAAVLVFLTCMGETRPMTLIAVLAGGWVAYLARVIPRIQLNPGMIAMGVVCLAGVIAFGHFTASWIIRDPREDGKPQTWRFRSTLLSVSAVLLLFVAGMAATGIAHQGFWLGKEKWFESGFRRADKVRCMSNLRQIGQVLMIYANENQGKYPDSLIPLVKDDGIEPATCICPATGFEIPGDTPKARSAWVHEHISHSYIYLTAGKTSPAADEVVAHELLENHEGKGMHVLFGSGAVIWFDHAKAVELLEALDAKGKVRN